MALYIFITALVLFMGWFVNTAFNKKNIVGRDTATISRQEQLNRILLFSVFMILFSLSALRIGIGNDYWEYRYRFLDIAGGKTPVSYEPGFKCTVLLMQKLFGLDNYRTTFALFAFLTCAFFIKGIYDTADWFFYSFFLYMANGFYFMSFSNVRYYFAFAVTVYAMQYLFKKKYISFILWICFAALFHKTVLVVIPIYIVAYFLKWNKKTVWLIPLGSAALFFGKIPIRWVIFKFYPFYEGDLLYDTGSFSPINICKCGAILIFCLLFYKEAIKGNEKAEVLFNLNLFALIFYCFGTYIPELSRICYYMVLGQIFLIPIVLKGIKTEKLRKLFTYLIAAAYVGYFIMFLIKGKSSYVMILPYLTWLFT